MSSTATADNKSLLIQLMQVALQQVAPEQAHLPFVMTRPKNPEHGDYACNLAMQLARPLKQSPRHIAEQLLAALPATDIIAASDIAGAGFINFTLTQLARQRIIVQVLTQGATFGQTQLGQKQRVQIEFVSANPTGPLHVGHGRGAAYGASLANILAYAGFAVAREYYVNDAGRQMDILALSTWLRYLELWGVQVPFPANAYQGDYVVSMAQTLLTEHAQQFVHPLSSIVDSLPATNNDENYLDALIVRAKTLLGQGYIRIHQQALTTQLNDGKSDLAEFGVVFDRWFSEQSLYDSGEVKEVIATLHQAGYIYEANGAKWFRSTAFGDEKDRVVQRENGIYTYFASDIAYLKNKFARGFSRLIYVCGADHHGYIPRMLGAAKALGFNTEDIDFPLVQFAVLYRQGEKVAMSTRSGEFVTLRALRAEVGCDAARFFYILRKSDQHLDFDLDLAKSQSNENPVYYIQYAHARICRILEDARFSVPPTPDLSQLTLAHETQLLRRLADFTDVINTAAQEYAPHLVAFYLKELAADFHSYYNVARILVEDQALSRARLALASSIKQVLANGLTLLGVSAPQKM
jgi:arginyl-tRNA synthetase